MVLPNAGVGGVSAAADCAVTSGSATVSSAVARTSSRARRGAAAGAEGVASEGEAVVVVASLNVMVMFWAGRRTGFTTG